MPEKQMPKIGQTVQYFLPGSRGKQTPPLAAMITTVWEGGDMVNLAIFMPDGKPMPNPPTAIHLVQDGSHATMDGNYCIYAEGDMQGRIPQPNEPLVAGSPGPAMAGPPSHPESREEIMARTSHSTGARPVVPPSGTPPVGPPGQPAGLPGQAQPGQGQPQQQAGSEPPPGQDAASKTAPNLGEKAPKKP